MSTHAPSGAQYEVSIEGQIHPWAKDTITVAEIRQLAGIPADVRVAAVDLAAKRARILEEDAVFRCRRASREKRASDSELRTASFGQST